MPRPRTNFPPLPALLADYRQAQRRLNITPRTTARRRHKVIRLADHHAPRHVLELGTEDIECWLDTLPIRPESRITYIGELRSFYGWARQEGWVRVDPSRDLVRPRVPRGLPRPVPDGELAEALSAASPRTLAMLALMAYEGLRCIEVSRLRAEDIDRRAMTLRIWGKGDKTRLVPLHPECLAALDAYGLPARGPLFTSRSTRDIRQPGKAISAEWISTMISRTLPGAYTAHQLRHWFGTMFYRASRDLLLTQQAMGHARPETTAGYAKADTSKMAEVVGKLTLPQLEVSGADGWGRPDDDPPLARAL